MINKVMNFFIRFWKYLNLDSEDDLKRKATSGFIQKFIIVAVLTFFEYNNMLDFVGNESITNHLTLLLYFFGGIDGLVALNPKLKWMFVAKTFIFEIMLFISLFILAPLYNILDMFRPLLDIQMDFLIALGLMYIFQSSWNLISSYLQADNNKDVRDYGNFIVWVNSWIIFQGVMITFMGLNYSNSMDLADFYPNMLRLLGTI